MPRRLPEAACSSTGTWRAKASLGDRLKHHPRNAVADLNGRWSSTSPLSGELGCFVYFNDGKGHFGSAFSSGNRRAERVGNEERMPYSMYPRMSWRWHPISSGYVDALRNNYNDGTAGTSTRMRSRWEEQFMEWPSGDLDGDGGSTYRRQSDAPSLFPFNRGRSKRLGIWIFLASMFASFHLQSIGTVGVACKFYAR